jgi:hypothetical protein
MTQLAVQRALENLDVPPCLWRSDGIDDFCEGPRVDGRTILARLNPITLLDGTP